MRKYLPERFVLALALLLGLGACGSSGKTTPSESAAAGALTITSSEFKEGEAVPKQYTGEGDDRSPPLAWSNLPEKTKELALVCDDPDAPGEEPWVHWVVYKIPADLKGLDEGVGAGDARFKQGKNDFGEQQYNGPMPPPGHGVHHYRFTLYALDAPVDVPDGARKKELLAAIKGHVLAQGTRTGTYERK